MDIVFVGSVFPVASMQMTKNRRATATKSKAWFQKSASKSKRANARTSGYSHSHFFSEGRKTKAFFSRSSLWVCRGLDVGPDVVVVDGAKDVASPRSEIQTPKSDSQ